MNIRFISIRLDAAMLLDKPAITTGKVFVN